jgi:heterodisulfide reductase subunit D
MSLSDALSLDPFLQTEAREIAAACSTCGECVRVCPVVPYGAAAGASATDVVRGVVDLLADRGHLTEASRAWIESCNGCGECIPVCPEAINPRKMISLACAKDTRSGSKTPDLYRRMSRAIKIMVGMQLLPAEFRRVFSPEPRKKVDLVFYLGCNALRTPHLLFNCMTMLDSLGAHYAVVGGPSSCCGVIATKWEGRAEVGAKVTGNTMDGFEGYEPDKVLNWCPTCQLHLGETLDGYRQTSYEFDHVTKYLASHINTFREKFVRAIPKKVVVHAHVGRSDICRDIDILLRAIPGLEIVETVFESGYTCGGSGCSKAPALAAKEHSHLIQRVRELGADALVTLYHGCHAIFAGTEADGHYEVLNYTDLLVEALGEIPHKDKLKEYKLLDDWKLIAEEGGAYLRENGLTVDPDWLAQHGPAIFASLEFKGELHCFD